MGELRRHRDVQESEHDMSFAPVLRAVIEELAIKMYPGGHFTIASGASPMFEQLKSMLRTINHVPEETAKKYAEAERMAEGLVKILAEKHYPNLHDAKVQTGDLVGMLLQIDNMTAGLERPKPQRDFAPSLRNVHINARFEVTSGDITGMTDADVKRVEFEDDGSLTVVIDHWPIEPKVFP